MILIKMNPGAHIAAHLHKLHTMPELIQFMFKQGFMRTSKMTWECTERGFAGHEITIKRTNGHFEVVV